MHKVYLFLFLALIHNLSFLQLVQANTLDTAHSFGSFDTTTNYNYTDSEQWYKFNLTAGEGITVTISPHINSSSLYLELFDPAEHEIAQAVENGTGGMSIDNNETGWLNAQAPVTGTYYLKITASSSSVTGNFDLTVYSAWYNVDVIDAQRNFYSSYDTAQLLVNGTYTNIANRKSYFRFSAKKDDNLDLTISPHFTSGYVHAYIYDAFNRELASVFSIENNVPKHLRDIIHKDGLYYVIIVGNGVGSYDLNLNGFQVEIDSDGDGLFNSAEYFHRTNILDVDSDGGGIDDRTELSQGASPIAVTEYVNSEVGSSLASASPLPYFNALIITSYEITGSESHWHSFNVNEGEGFTATLTVRSGWGGLYLELFDSSGNFLKKAYEIGGLSQHLADGEVVMLRAKVETTGTYYLKITTDKNSTTIGKYGLTVYPAWYNTGVTDNQRKFYACYESARLLNNGTFTRSIVSSDGTVISDFYRFSAQSGETVNLTLEPRLNTGNIYAYLYDPSNTRIGTISNLDDGEKGRMSVPISTDGVYYVQISGYSGDGEYDLNRIYFGDVDGSLNVDLTDLILSLQVITGQNPTDVISSGDVNGDYRTDMAEVLYILQDISL